MGLSIRFLRAAILRHRALGSGAVDGLSARHSPPRPYVDGLYDPVGGDRVAGMQRDGLLTREIGIAARNDQTEACERYRGRRLLAEDALLRQVEDMPAFAFARAVGISWRP